MTVDVELRLPQKSPAHSSVRAQWTSHLRNEIMNGIAATRKIERIRGDVERFYLIPTDGMIYRVIPRDGCFDDTVVVSAGSGPTKTLAWGTLVSVARSRTKKAGFPPSREQHSRRRY